MSEHLDDPDDVTLADYLSRCTPKGAYPFGLALFAWIGV